MGKKTKYSPDSGASQERYLNLKSASETFGLTVSALRSMIKRRDIPSYRLGTRRMLKYSEIEALFVRYPSKKEVTLDDD